MEHSGAEEPHSKITLNVDGNLTVGLSAKFKNIDELNINTCNGNVNIDCNAIGGADTFAKSQKSTLPLAVQSLLLTLEKLVDSATFKKKSVHLFGPIAENVYSLEPPAAADSSLSIKQTSQSFWVLAASILLMVQKLAMYIAWAQLWCIRLALLGIFIPMAVRSSKE